MLKKTIAAVALIATCAFSADNVMNFSIGPTWPKSDHVKENHPQVAWNGSAEWGKVFDKRIIVGAKMDFSWHVTRKEGTWNDTTLMYDDTDNIYRKYRLFMVPVSLWFGIDPVPQYRFHPVVHMQIGYNSLFYKELNYEGSETPDKDEFKYYKGFISKFGIDGMFDLGKQASIFAGFEYQIAPLYYSDGNKLKEMSFNAPAIRLGVSFLY